MGADSILSASTLLGFILTLTRVGGIFVFVPLPGAAGGLPIARVVLVFGITVALFPLWPHPAATVSAGLFAVWTLAEASLGTGIGLLVAFLTESFALGAQMIGLQAGLSFASTVDPSTQADSTVLSSIVQTATLLIFFVTGLDREVIRIFAASLVSFPPGSFTLSKGAAEAVLSVGGVMFASGLRLALPVIAVLIMIDMSLALLGRINAQLQLFTIASPAKLFLSVVLLIWISVLLPTLFRGTADAVFGTARSLVGR